MPTYVYKFTESGETIEVVQSFDDASLTELAHPRDGVVRAVKKVFQPVGVTFKGSGFYKTDSRGGAAKTAATVPAASNGDASSSSSSTDSSSTSDSSSNGSSTESSKTSSTSGDSSSSPTSTPAAKPAATPASSS